jgi:hypothetical protein
MLKLNINEYSNCIQRSDTNKNGSTKRLKLIITEHQTVLDLTKKVDNIFNVIEQSQLGFNNVTISLAGYAFIIVSHCLIHT